MADINSNVNVGDNRGQVTGIDSRGANTNRTDVNVHHDNPHFSQESIDLVRELRLAIFGDGGMRWDGVLPGLRQVQKEVEKLHKTVVTLQNSFDAMQKEMHDIRLELSNRRIANQHIRLLLWAVVVGIVVLIVIALWPLIRG
jgi:hypothetical protein